MLLFIYYLSQLDLKNNLFKFKKPYSALIPLKDRLYDFSFIGRLDRPGRIELIKELKTKFKKIYLHDSSNGYLSNEELSNVIKKIEGLEFVKEKITVLAIHDN